MVAVVIGVSLVGAPVLFFVLATLHSMVRSLGPGMASAANALIWIPIWWQWIILPYQATHVFGGWLGVVLSVVQLGVVATAVGFFTRDTNRRTALLTIIASVAATGWLTLFALRGVTGRWPIFG